MICAQNNNTANNNSYNDDDDDVDKGEQECKITEHDSAAKDLH